MDNWAKIDKFFNKCNLLPQNSLLMVHPPCWTKLERTFVYCQFTSSPRDTASGAIISSAGTEHNPEKANNAKHSKTKLPWSSRLLRHSAKKRDGLTLQCSGEQSAAHS